MSPTPSELKTTRSFAEKGGMPQGGIFIRELLRHKRQDHPDVRIGISKDEVRENLLAAIDAGAVNMTDLETRRRRRGVGQPTPLPLGASPVAKLPLWEPAVPAALSRSGHGGVEKPATPLPILVGGSPLPRRPLDVVLRRKDEHWWRTTLETSRAR